MKKYPKILLLLIGVSFALVYFPLRKELGQATGANAPKNNLRKVLSKNSALPQVAQFEQPQAVSTQVQERRQSRQQLSQGLYTHNPIFDPGLRDANGEVETIDLTFIDGVTIAKVGEREDPPGLPISDSTIVIGTVVNGDAYINGEHTGVFSEYMVSVNEVLKPDPANSISVGSEISVWRPGGSLKFPSGHIRHFIISGRGYPEAGTQYVFFLRRPDPKVKDYAIATAFSLRKQIVSPMDDRDDQLAFDGTSSIGFLDKVRKEVIAGREEGSKQ